MYATGVSIHGILIRAHPPLGEVSRLDNTDSVLLMGLSHSPDIPDGVSSDVILQDCIIIVITIVISVKATCNYINTEQISIYIVSFCKFEFVYTVVFISSPTSDRMTKVPKVFLRVMSIFSKLGECQGNVRGMLGDLLLPS